MINRDKGRQPFLAPAWTSREKRLPPNVEEWLVQPTETFVPLRADLEARGSVFAICLSSPSARHERVGKHRGSLRKGRGGSLGDAVRRERNRRTLGMLIKRFPF